MNDTLEKIITIVVIVLVIVFCAVDTTGRWIMFGSLVLICLIGALIAVIDNYILTRKHKRIESTSQKYPQGYNKYIREHHLSQDDIKWNRKQRRRFLSVRKKTWESMQLDEEQKIEAEKARRKAIDVHFNSIESKAPHGLKHWLKKNGFYATWEEKDFHTGYRYSLKHGLKRVGKEDVLKFEDIILQFEDAYCKCEQFFEWEDEQNKFSSEFNSFAKEKLMKNYGLSKHNISYVLPDVEIEEEKVDFEVLQYYYLPFNLDKSYDYSLLPHLKAYSELVENNFELKERPEGLITSDLCYLKFFLFFSDLFKEGLLNNCSFVFFDDIESVLQDSVYVKYEAKRARLGIAKLAQKYGCSCYHLSELLANNTPDLQKRIIIISHIAYNARIEELCRQIILSHHGRCPNMVFLSIYKELNPSNMQELISKQKEAILTEEERKRKEAEREQHEKELLSSMISKVKDWETLWGGIKINYLLDYYPTTVEFDANEREWADRWVVWNFKNDPDKTTELEHQRSLNWVVPELERLLKRTFGDESLGYLTLACVPASTPEKNEARYKDFSNILCQKTGMENAYSYIQVTREKTAKHEGGEDDVVNYTFDGGFFNGKRVILFDDIITKGNSMRNAKTRLENLGAKVICGIAVGKTRHERREQD